jgi:hypothetical protein
MSHNKCILYWSYYADQNLSRTFATSAVKIKNLSKLFSWEPLKSKTGKGRRFKQLTEYLFCFSII